MPLAGVVTDVQLGFLLVVYATLFFKRLDDWDFPGSKLAHALPFSDG